MAVARLAEGGLIDRSRPLSFQFDGRIMGGFAGDTLASALIANGVTLVGRSFKYHRPRGILTAGSEEPNALVELRGGARREPNTKATTIELFDGLVAHSQNRWPSLALDLLSVNSLLAPLLGPGFYYKTFKWPSSFWERFYEPAIRRAAGLGRPPTEPDPDRYETAFAFCDVLVVGAGPAGLMAALAASRAGARVILCDEDFSFGGRLLAEKYDIDGEPALVWAAAAVDELDRCGNATLMRRSTVFGVYDSGTYGVLERVGDHLATHALHAPRQRLWRIVARRAVLAAGAIERPIIFGGNDRPGVMMASAVRSYVNRFAASPGRRLAVFTNNDDGWKTVADCAAAGIAVDAVIDSRRGLPERLRMLARSVDARLLEGAQVLDAFGVAQGLRGIDVATESGPPVSLQVDCLAVSGGWNPTLALTCHLGDRPDWSEDLAAFIPGRIPPGLGVAGAANGSFALADCLAEGFRAGAQAAEAIGFAAPAPAMPAVDAESTAVRPLWHVAGARTRAFVDFQNDVTTEDIGIAAREGYRSVELLKRYTTLGMATDQGKTANINGLAILAELTGRSVPQTGTTNFRPPYAPVAIGAFAGHRRGKNYRPTSLPPSHGWATERGAVFTEDGAWLRARYFPLAGEDALAAISREAGAVHAGVGVCDVSPAGEIELFGSDAARFLDHVMVNDFASLAVNATRFGVMLREDGLVMNQAMVVRLGELHFVIALAATDTARTLGHLEFCRQVLWPGLDVQLADSTGQWARFAIAGPRARALLGQVVDPGGDVSIATLPEGSIAASTVGGGIPARVLRVSWSGAPGYQLAVPARYGDAIIRALVDAGGTPFGSGALDVVRIEQGYVGEAEMDGTTTLHDLGFGALQAAGKDNIGRILAMRQGLTDPDRPEISGFRPVDRSQRLRAGAHFLPLGAEATAANDQGSMTSVAFSPSLGHWIGLGFIRSGTMRLGERVRAYDPVRGFDIEVEITSKKFIDRTGELPDV